jgi:hypothetical protein
VQDAAESITSLDADVVQLIQFGDRWRTMTAAVVAADTAVCTS